MYESRIRRESSSERKQFKLTNGYRRKMKTSYGSDPFIAIINQLLLDSSRHHLYAEEVFSEADFWKILNRSLEQNNGDINQLYLLVEKELRKFSLQQIIIFYRLFIRQRIRAYNWGIYQAFRLITGDPDEDSFDSFKDWLILDLMPFMPSCAQALEVVDAFIEHTEIIELKDSDFWDNYSVGDRIEELLPRALFRVTFKNARHAEIFDNIKWETAFDITQ